MATYIAYDDLVLQHGPLAYWRMVDNDSLPVEDATGNGHDITSFDGEMSFSSKAMFDYAPPTTGLRLSNFGGSPTIANQSAIVSAINAQEAVTMILWLRPEDATAGLRMPQLAWDNGEQTQFNNFNDLSVNTSDGGSKDVASLSEDAANMLVIMADATRDYAYLNGFNVLDQARSSAIWPGLSTIKLVHEAQGTGNDIAWGTVYDKTLTNSEIADLWARRNFQGRIAGTMTLDGSPTADATVRSFRRSDGKINGETTSAADGTYEITVLDNVECDLLALPPTGVAARPLAHGPIVPDPYTQ